MNRTATGETTLFLYNSEGRASGAGWFVAVRVWILCVFVCVLGCLRLRLGSDFQKTCRITLGVQDSIVLLACDKCIVAFLLFEHA